MRLTLSAVSVFALAVAVFVVTPKPSFAADADCPNGGTVRYGVEPFEAAPKLVPIFDHIGQLLSEKLGCKVEIQVTTNYNAEIEAMRAGKLEAGEFGPLGYVLAHQVAKAEAFATASDAKGNPDTYTASIVTYEGSPVKTMKDLVGHTFAFSDPASTSGHLYPAYAMRKIGIDPDKDVKGVFAGSHTASFEALHNHKVDAGELNSQQKASSALNGSYHEGDFITLWQSDPIPNDPICVRGDLPDGFKKRFEAAFLALDLSQLSADDRKIIGVGGMKYVPQTDAAYNIVRDLVSTLNIDLNKLD
jgi:phosphonate transport system substrate-binding protein